MERARARLAPSGPADRGDIVLGWLTKLTVVLAVVGLIGFDLIALGVNRMQAEDRAGTAARAAVSSYSSSKNVQQAYDAAVGTLDDEVTDRIDPGSFTVDSDGGVTLTLERETTTFLVEKIGPIRDWATATATRTARPAR